MPAESIGCAEQPRPSLDQCGHGSTPAGTTATTWVGHLQRAGIDQLIDACEDHEVRFSITVRATASVVAAIAGIDEDAWLDIDYTDGGHAQVGETTLAGRRLIVRRTRLTGPQATLWPDWRHHAFVTNRDGDAIALDADHRHHAVEELVIRDLKQGAGLNHCPSGVFWANAA